MPRDLAEVFRLLGSVGEGAELLALGKRKNVDYAYDDTLPPAIGGRKALSREGLSLRPVVLLNPSWPASEQVGVLGHELYHVWQDMQTGPIPHGLQPRLRLGVTRVREGAAYAFEMHLRKTLGAQTGLDLPFRPRRLFERLRTDVDWARAFQDFQKTEGGSYDVQVSALCETLAAAVVKETPGGALIVTQLKEVFNTEALGDLRKLTRRGLSPDAPAYLAFRDNAALLDSVLAHVDPKILARASALTP